MSAREPTTRPTDPWGLVRAGGDGTRLHALTPLIAGRAMPNRYCRITGERSMLEATLDRIASLIPPGRALGPCLAMESVLDRPGALDAHYPTLVPWNFSRDFLDRIPRHLAVLRADDLGWSDWGTPEAIARTLTARGQTPSWWARAERVAASGAA